MASERPSRFGLRAKLSLVVGVPLLIAACLIAIFVVSRSIADGHAQLALEWDEHAIGVLDLETKANAYFDAVTENAPLTKLAEIRAELEAADENAIQLAGYFDSAEQREQRAISRSLHQLVNAPPTFGSFELEERYNTDVAPVLEAVAREELEGSRQHAAAGRAASKSVLTLGLIVSLFLLAIGVYVAFVRTREILRGVDRLTRGVEQLRTGKLDERIEVVSQDELGHLAAVFNSMSASLHEHRSNLEVLVAKRLEEAQQLENQLRQAQKMEAVGQLAGGIAHDFNNILAVIIANAELTLMDMPLDNPARADIDEIVAAAKRAADLTRQLLAFSRKQTTEPKNLDLNGLVTTSERMLRRVIGESIKISMDLAPDLYRTWADASQLDQVLTNLVINARDAMPAGGRLLIETSNDTVDVQRAEALGLAPGPYVALSVTDTGTGMDDETRARVFEPFFTTKEVGKGTGLGLAMVFGIVTQHHGRIEIESAVGVGTTFRILLPRSSTDVSAVAVAPKGRPLAGGTEEILVVEDDEQLRHVLARQLTALGYKVHVAGNAEAALATLARLRNRVDLVLTDLVMPDMDGRQLALEIQRRRYRTSVLFMSGYSQHPKLDLPNRLAEGTMLAKPIMQDTLAAAVRGALSQRRSARITAPRLAMDELNMVNGLFSE